MNRIDYPIHDYVRWIQSGTLYRLHHPRIFSRIRDNELKFPRGDDIFTLAELFQDISTSLWSELKQHNNINSFRRDLQKSHVEVLSIILLNEKSYFHSDAVALARALNAALDLDVEHRKSMAEVAIRHVQKNFTLDKMCDSTLAVYREVLASEQPVASKR